ncbi:MAG: cytochrome P450 [Burkholderiaceae bacterium]|nr:cytochrome P450 [Burkholderiaceae bacterium]
MNTATRCVDDYSFMDPAIQDNPFEFYELLQKERPVYKMPETGFYVVTRYEDVRRVVSDPKTFSNDLVREKEFQGDRYKIHADVLAKGGWPLMQTLQRTDPPVHGRYRRLLDKIFTPRQVQELKPRIDGIVNKLIDGFIDKGECEFVHDFALMLPGLLIAEQIGLDDDILTFKRWVDAMFATGMLILSEDEIRKAAETELEAQLYFAKIFEDRRKNPRNDIVSHLVQSSLMGDEEPLTTQELQSLMRHIVAAGFESTASALASGMQRLINHPDQLAKLQADRSLMPNFVEEVLRIDSPVQGHFRKALADVTVGDVLIPKGSIVIPRYGAANHDAAQFACPHAFDVTRTNSRHFAFGMGTHFCLGANLARQEINSAFTIILDRMDDFALTRPLDTPAHQVNFILYVLKELPIRFRKLTASAGVQS